ncbi:50S ribosome-binding GTPase [Prosthecobacter fusiformis]|uniref:50S ribosome-binding GTPase n=1 Tax=Prosthecobacter fusiformis TaxID=48464 RepID=A0A4R7S4L7_9BACT|nr:dynamin family protein [Prosthecobacter fusiformis]TDU73274.1 50S ribosome-binding GTPase [Prosthecobacter fusiformis]
MIGDEYFQLRDRLSGELHTLAEVIRDLGGDTESIAIAENLIASLKEPFVFVVVGEVNVGKSTFLNALFGQDFSKTGVMPTTDKILFFKHGPVLQIVPVTPTLDEVHVPIDILRDFHIVDTPGTNSIADEHQEITERFVPIADLVIFVFSAMNPWGASAWQFLDKVHKHWMRHVVFVLQQCDLRSPEEIQVITDYMGQLSRQRYGQDFPLFPVSAKKAYIAKNSDGNQESLMEESGFQQLEDHISSLVERNASRMNKLSSTVRLARQLLTNLREHVLQQTQQTQRTSTLTQEFLTEREMQVDRTLKKILPALDATERDYHEACAHVAGLADDVLATRQAFKKDPALEMEETKPESLDHRLFQDLQHRSGDRWRQVGIILEEDCLQYDRFLHSQGRGTLFPEDVVLPTEADPELRRLFSAHIDSTIRRFVLGLKLDEAIEPGLNKARKRARWVPWLILPVLGAVGAAWYYDGPIGAAISAGGGMLLLGFALLIAQSALNKTRGLMVDRLENSTLKLREMLQTQVESDVESLFSRFLPMLEPAQKECREREHLLLSQTERLQALTDAFLIYQRELSQWR